MINWKFKNDAEPQGSSSGFWYDLIDGGYIRPEELLKDEKQLKELENAIEIVKSFEQALEDNELLIEY